MQLKIQFHDGALKSFANGPIPTPEGAEYLLAGVQMSNKVGRDIRATSFCMQDGTAGAHN